MKLVVSDLNEFVFELYMMFGEDKKENLFVFFYSIFIVLVMMYVGVEGVICDEMVDVLNFNFLDD